eukprot:TRINITY_DN7740_c0_g1_i1.p1 TRINITY_DN7740_c0_g1~~TRINITY_DN7740_c0_g1_i1.p1  ORF type:complete len:328 (-),score=31.85 TRINITY_DN7740_c0_g1_i1:114-1097(-)
MDSYTLSPSYPDVYMPHLLKHGEEITTLEIVYENDINNGSLDKVIPLCPRLKLVKIRNTIKRGHNSIMIDLGVFAALTGLTRLEITSCNPVMKGGPVPNGFPALETCHLEHIFGAMEAFSALAAAPLLRRLYSLGYIDHNTCYLDLPFGRHITEIVLKGNPPLYQKLLELIAPLRELEHFEFAPGKIADTYDMPEFLARLNPKMRSLHIQNFPLGLQSVKVLQTHLLELETLDISFRMTREEDIGELLKIPTLTTLRILPDSVEVPISAWQLFAVHSKLKTLHVPQVVARQRDLLPGSLLVEVGIFVAPPFKRDPSYALPLPDDYYL